MTVVVSRQKMMENIVRLVQTPSIAYVSTLETRALWLNLKSPDGELDRNGSGSLPAAFPGQERLSNAGEIVRSSASFERVRVANVSI